MQGQWLPPHTSLVSLPMPSVQLALPKTGLVWGILVVKGADFTNLGVSDSVVAVGWLLACPSAWAGQPSWMCRS